ncbi:hypothetical protein BCR44DRAFT_27322 [Catenaria anguillulae PL171]|uniref:Uncharacterized protein n=1 Tax=Catenaria anguillulae PL171 TaxID=765915 RepID=A0A1Y2HFD0_9FUNG|nr:hypothetical protein BCR44DRAFT_27322 [Catenaria anguillulae PL171]
MSDAHWSKVPWWEQNARIVGWRLAGMGDLQMTRQKVADWRRTEGRRRVLGELVVLCGLTLWDDGTNAAGSRQCSGWEDVFDFVVKCVCQPRERNTGTDDDATAFIAAELVAVRHVPRVQSLEVMEMDGSRGQRLRWDPLQSDTGTMKRTRHANNILIMINGGLTPKVDLCNSWSDSGCRDGPALQQTRTATRAPSAYVIDLELGIQTAMTEPIRDS